MAGSPFDRSERLMRLMGDALVTWGEIESLWRRVFCELLFRDFKHPRDRAIHELGGRGDDELSLAEERAYAAWDTLQSSKAQLDMVQALAPLVFADPEQAAGLARLISVAEDTHKMRGRRNAIAHGAFERTLRLKPGANSRAHEEFRAAAHAHKAIRGQDLDVAIPKILEEFRTHREDVRKVWLWLKIGRPKDAGAPSPDTAVLR